VSGSYGLTLQKASDNPQSITQEHDFPGFGLSPNKIWLHLHMGSESSL